MRPSTARDRLHAAVVALALCSTSVSIVVAGQPQDGVATVSDPAVVDSASAQRGESVDAMRSFTDMIAEAAREQERLSAATPSEECVTVVDASVSGPERNAADTPRDAGATGRATTDLCGEPPASAAL